jgi:hypothetical protein
MWNAGHGCDGSDLSNVRSAQQLQKILPYASTSKSERSKENSKCLTASSTDGNDEGRCAKTPCMNAKEDMAVPCRR